MRNPPWNRDELIVALDFYKSYAPQIPGKTSREVPELSDFMGRLARKTGRAATGDFRNVNAVYMKLMNFRRCDPSYKGTGLVRGNKDEQVVWDLFASNREKLRATASSIRSLVDSDGPLLLAESVSHDEEEGEEGSVLTRVHRYRERDPSLVARKKQQVLKENNSLACEVCGFDFDAFYGAAGNGFIECHHTRPLSELSRYGETVRLHELSLVCSNCHRMIHRRRPWLSIAELKALVQQTIS